VPPVTAAAAPAVAFAAAADRDAVAQSQSAPVHDREERGDGGSSQPHRISTNVSIVTSPKVLLY